MNTHDIELPPIHYDELPEPDDPLPAMRNYARAAVEHFLNQSGQYITNDASRQAAIDAAVEADRKRITELESQLEGALTERDAHHDMADQLSEQIAAITGQEIGEHSSGNDPWQNAMLAADEWIADDLRKLTDGSDRKRRGSIINNASTSSEPVATRFREKKPYAGTDNGWQYVKQFQPDEIWTREAQQEYEAQQLFVDPQPLSESDTPAEPVNGEELLAAREALIDMGYLWDGHQWVEVDPPSKTVEQAPEWPDFARMEASLQRLKERLVFENGRRKDLEQRLREKRNG